MRTTYPEAKFEFVDVSAITDSTPTAEQVQEFAKVGLLKNNGKSALYGTLEKNQFVLDGSRTVMPAEITDVSYCSRAVSDTNCEYETPQAVEVLFTKTHSSIGLTLHFPEEPPAKIKITWYSLSGIKIDAAFFYPDRQDYFCKHPVEDYGKVKIEFLQSAFPGRYAKLDFIEYGYRWYLEKDKIKTASVYEEIDVTSTTLSINTASLEILDEAGDFDISNQKGLWKYFQNEQKAQLTEYINGSARDCGTFYLNKWDCQKNRVKINMIDLVGIMDKTKFYGGKIYEAEKAGTIIHEIMTSAGVTDFQVAPEVAEKRLTGWLGIQSHRAALQQVLFACGAVADCSRGEGLRIYIAERYVSHTIGLNRKFLGTKVTLDEYVSAVAINYIEYHLDEEIKQVSKTTLPQGMHKIEFSAPYLPTSLSVSAGTVKEAATNFIVIELAEEQECVITGRGYIAEENTYTARVPLIEAGEKEKTKSYSKCTLMDMVQAKETAENILDFYKLRQMVEMRYINDGEAVGNWCNLELASGGYVTTGIVNQTLDLTGGNLATVKCRGYSAVTTDDAYTGEIYGGERGLI